MHLGHLLVEHLQLLILTDSIFPHLVYCLHVHPHQMVSSAQLEAVEKLLYLKQKKKKAALCYLSLLPINSLPILGRLF